MDTIMLCFNQAGIGGVETAAFNQTIQLIKKGYRVIILAKDGIYRKKFEEQGAIFEEFEYVIQNKYDLEKISYIANLLDKYDIGQVHIHQFDCLSSVFPACMIKGIPYVAYLHTGIKGVYNWFENSYPIYKILFEIYFKSAEKIIAITEMAKRENQEKYKIDDNKYLIIKNSINFEEINQEQNVIPKKVEKFLIISRLSEEKMTSIKNSIKLFKNYYNINNSIKLTIVGDGNCRNEVEKEVEEIKDVVQLLGQRNDVMELIAENDIVLGLDRCILETITMKKLAILSGYDDIKGVLTPDIIEKASDDNFSGRNLENHTVLEVIQQIENMDEETIKNIIEQNFQFAYNNLNVKNNYFAIDNVDGKKTYLNSTDLLMSIMSLQNEYAENIEYTDSVYKECKEAEKWFQNKIDYLEKELEIKEKAIVELDARLSENAKKINNLSTQLNKNFKDRAKDFAKNIIKKVNNKD